MPSQNMRHWLNAKRLTLYPRMLFFILLATTVYRFLTAKGLVDRWGLPLGSDFVTFWAASRIGLGEKPETAYSLDVISRVEKLAVPLSDTSWAWFYPPTFYIVILPLSLLPYLVAYAVFILPAAYFYLKTLLRIANSPSAIWGVAAFPGLWICLLHGQNAFLTATLAGSGILALSKRPLLAGILIGLLVIKPHLGILFPLALLAAGRWEGFFSASCSALALLVAGFIVFGWDTYIAFFHSLQDARVYMEAGALPWAKMPSWFALLRGLGASITLSYVVQFVFAAWSIVLTWKIWRDSTSSAICGSALMTATFLISPYVYDYDLVWLGFPLCWLARLGASEGWAPMDIEILVAAWLLPLLMPFMASTLSFQVGPFVLSALLWMIWRRHLADLLQKCTP